MKKLLLALSLLVLATSAQAEWHGGYRGGYGGWVAPALIGGVVGYELARPYYAPPPVVYVQPQTVYVQQPPAPPAGYHYQQIVDTTCNCYKTALVPN